MTFLIPRSSFNYPGKEAFYNKLTNNFLDEFFKPSSLRENIAQSSLAATDLKEDKDNIYITCELPGIDKKEVNIEYKDGLLSISGEKKQEVKKKDENSYYKEISYGNFYREIKVGSVDFSKSKADFKNGVLQITLPKTENLKTQRLEIG
ncbi:Hsp20/alpha crystallin family protein [Candidatus Margulisiibacteriota bacterium]